MLTSLFCALALVPGRAFAEGSAAPDAAPETPKAARALVTGFLVAGGALAGGSYLLASHASLNAKHAGLGVMFSGLSLAPLAAHGVVDEWWRGALFAIPPAAAGGGMIALLSAHPEAPIKGKNKSQRWYPLLISLGVVGSAVGIVDAALVNERAPAHVVVSVSDDLKFAGVEGCF